LAWCSAWPCALSWSWDSDSGIPGWNRHLTSSSLGGAEKIADESSSSQSRSLTFSAMPSHHWGLRSAFSVPVQISSHYFYAAAESSSDRSSLRRCSGAGQVPGARAARTLPLVTTRAQSARAAVQTYDHVLMVPPLAITFRIWLASCLCATKHCRRAFYSLKSFSHFTVLQLPPGAQHASSTRPSLNPNHRTTSLSACPALRRNEPN
jgi:hypothetical protein